MADHRAPDTTEIPIQARPGPVPPVDTPPAPPEDPPAQRLVEDSGKRPEPVLNAAKVAGAISGVILSIGGVLRLLGVLIPVDYDLQALADQSSAAVLAVGVAWSLVGPWIVARIRARDRVTPLTDPRDATGRPLVPEET
ncbi:hypothetical protein [Longimicrobium sp.]|jgi:hypothetical protein|uniref:hypothetical protein n=1 Tax=Longimicrobium sp. TaxID=2029185 RepID=UPI002EDA5E51